MARWSGFPVKSFNAGNLRRQGGAAVDDRFRLSRSPHEWFRAIGFGNAAGLRFVSVAIGYRLLISCIYLQGQQ